MLASEPDPPPDPRFAEFANGWSWATSSLHDGEERLFSAAGVLREMNRVSSPCGALLFNEAYLAKRNGDRDEARALYRRAAELDDEDAWTQFHLAQCHLDLHQSAADAVRPVGK